MSEGFAYLDILFFAMVAGFIALRLRSVLGRKTGEERRRGFGNSKAEKGSDNVVKMPERVPPPPPPMDGELVAESAVVGVRDIRATDRNFDPQGFLGGARTAFEMILGAFARGDRETLQNLLADDVYQGFESAINDREAADQRLDAEIIDMKQATIVDAAMEGKVAQVTVRYVTEQRNTLRDAEGEPVDGEGEAEEIVDLWTFERDTASNDPNWRLTETRTNG